MSTPWNLPSIASRLGGRPGPPEPSDSRNRAAVAAILRDLGGGEVELLLIRRAVRAGDPWSGHIALPGGHRAPEDATLLDTARRETFEEVGIDLARDGVLLGRLEELEAVGRMRRTGIVISPFVFVTRGSVEVASDPDEVAEAFWTPLAPLLRGDRAGVHHHDHGGETLAFPCFRLANAVVWGLTYSVLDGFLALLREET